MQDRYPVYRRIVAPGDRRAKASMPSYELISEVAPAKLATGDAPATGPVYRAKYAKDGHPAVPGVATCYDILQ